MCIIYCDSIFFALHCDGSLCMCVACFRLYCNDGSVYDDWKERDRAGRVRGPACVRAFVREITLVCVRACVCMCTGCLQTYFRSISFILYSIHRRVTESTLHSFLNQMVGRCTDNETCRVYQIQLISTSMMRNAQHICIASKVTTIK